jgi:hypothetical protein
MLLLPLLQLLVGPVPHLGEIRNSLNILVGKSERKKSHGKLRHRWENNIKMDVWCMV